MGCHPKPIDELIFFKIVKTTNQLYYLRAAAPAADPGKEKPVMVSAGFVRVFCESSAWMLYIYIIYIYICIK